MASRIIKEERTGKVLGRIEDYGNRITAYDPFNKPIATYYKGSNETCKGNTMVAGNRIGYGDLTEALLRLGNQ